MDMLFHDRTYNLFDDSGVHGHPESAAPDTACVKTGCIPCLSAQQRCIASNINCQYNSVSAQWRSIPRISDQWYGSWRQRHGYSMFMHFANAPERAGYLASGFWKHAVPTICHQDERLYLLASSLGSLYEYVLRRTEPDRIADHRTLGFAIDQCGIAVRLLAEIEQGLELEVALTACILLTFFESLQGYTRSAISHCMQGRKLLAAKNGLESTGWVGSYDVLQQLETMVLDLDIQARCVPGTMPADGDPLSIMTQMHLPSCTHLTNIEQADAALSYVHINLLNALNKVRASMGRRYHEQVMQAREERVVPWLIDWNTAFEMLVEFEEPTPRTRQRHNILRINYATILILCEFDITYGNRDWEVSLDRFRFIVDTSDSILVAYEEIKGLPCLSSERFPFMAHGHWMLEPLFITIARCTDYDIRRKAATILLSRRPPQTRCWSAKPNTCCPVDENGAALVDDLIKFAKNIRMDTGLAVFFGGFCQDSQAGSGPG